MCNFVAVHHNFVMEQNIAADITSCTLHIHGYKNDEVTGTSCKWLSVKNLLFCNLDNEKIGFKSYDV